MKIIQGPRRAITAVIADSIENLWTTIIDFKPKPKLVGPPFFLRLQANKVVKVRLKAHRFDYRCPLIQKPRIERSYHYE
jgi:hypothetical protein